MNGPTRPLLGDAWKRYCGGWLAAGIIVVTIFAAYSDSLSNPFVFDDVVAINQNATIRQLWPITAALSPPETSTVGGRPLANLSFALNYAFGGDSPWGYHAGNLALHILAALTLLDLIRRMLKRASVATRGQSYMIALIAASVWALHPLSTGAVSYVSQRTELMMTLFYLLTLDTFLRGTEGNVWPWWSLSIATCALGMASKEVMVTAP